MYTKSSLASHQLLTSLAVILCYTLHNLRRGKLGGTNHRTKEWRYKNAKDVLPQL
jgi:hypothetical protein